LSIEDYMVHEKPDLNHDEALRVIYEDLGGSAHPDSLKSGYPEAWFRERARRLERHLRTVVSWLGPGSGPAGPHRIVDIGCNNGALTSLIDAKEFTVYGVDFAESLVEEGRQKFPWVHFSAASCYDLPFAAGSFDVVVSLGVLDVLSDQPRYFGEMVRVLRSGGVGLLEFQAHLSRLERAARVPLYTLRGDWKTAASLVKGAFSPGRPGSTTSASQRSFSLGDIQKSLQGRQRWQDALVSRYRPRDVRGALLACGVSRTKILNLRHGFLKEYNTYMGFKK
jgi:SAM-dependent methyltransferase